MLVVALIAAVSFLQSLRADTVPEEITDQVPTKLLRVVNHSEVSVSTPAGSLINSVVWEKIWENITPRSYYLVVYRANKRLLVNGPREVTDVVYEFDLQAKAVTASYTAYVGHLRWWINGVPQHGNRSGYSYYDGDATSLAHTFGINSEDDTTVGQRH